MHSAPRSYFSLACFLAALVLPGAIWAQAYPAKPVRIVVPFVPGSGADIMTRPFAIKLTEMIGQRFFVDNRGGAAGNIGAESVARAAPDGYTLLSTTATLAMSQSLYKNITFDVSRDFEPVAFLASAPFMLVVHPSLPVRNVKELLSLARARPGELTFGSAGSGTGSQLSAELFKLQGGANILHVPYKGTPGVIADIMAGRISMMFGTNLLPHVRAGRLRALGMTSAQRSLIAPDIPTIAESGLPGFEAVTWFAVLAPAGTPHDIVARLNAAITSIQQSPGMRELLMTQSSADPMGGTPPQVGAHIKSEIEKWAKVVAASGTRLE